MAYLPPWLIGCYLPCDTHQKCFATAVPWFLTMRVHWWAWGSDWAGGRKWSSSFCSCFLDFSPLLLSSPSPESDWLAAGCRAHDGNERRISSSGGCWGHALLPATVTVHPALPETSPQMQTNEVKLVSYLMIVCQIWKLHGINDMRLSLMVSN
jgi:hypothetical protein